MSQIFVYAVIKRLCLKIVSNNVSKLQVKKLKMSQLLIAKRSEVRLRGEIIGTPSPWA